MIGASLHLDLLQSFVCSGHSPSLQDGVLWPSERPLVCPLSGHCLQAEEKGASFDHGVGHRMFVTCWSCVCHVCVTCWSCVRRVCVTCWSCVCRVCVTCWSCVCHMLVMCVSHACYICLACPHTASMHTHIDMNITYFYTSLF